MKMRKNSAPSSEKLWILLGIAAIFLVAFLFSRQATNYTYTVINSAIIYYFCSLGVVLMLGFCGQLSFAIISFMGIGAFLAGQLAKNFGVAPWLAIILATCATMIVSLVFGYLLLRLKGAFFVFGTIATVSIFSTIFQNYIPLSGGPNGLFGIPKLVLFGITFNSYSKWFWLLLILAVLCGLLVLRIRSTSLGRSMMAVRDNEIAAQVMGVNVFATKLYAFIISSGIAGFGGALLCFHNGVVSSTLFTFGVQMRFLTMAMLGGISSVPGSALGTLIVICLPEVLRVLQRYMNLIYGIAVVLMMIFMPTGIAGLLSGLARRLLSGRAEKQKGGVENDGVKG